MQTDDNDTAVVSDLLVKHRHWMLAYLYSFLRDYHAVEDVFQDVCVVAVRRAAEYRRGSNFWAWVKTIARFKTHEYLRKHRSIHLTEAAFATLESMDEQIKGNVELESRKDALRKCIESIGEKARRFLAWRYEEGLSPASIAEKSDHSRQAVNSVLQRIRATLRDCVRHRLMVRGT